MSLMTTSEEEQLMFKYVGNDPQEHTEKNEKTHWLSLTHVQQ